MTKKVNKVVKKAFMALLKNDKMMTELAEFTKIISKLTNKEVKLIMQYVERVKKIERLDTILEIRLHTFEMMKAMEKKK